MILIKEERIRKNSINMFFFAESEDGRKSLHILFGSKWRIIPYGEKEAEDMGYYLGDALSFIALGKYYVKKGFIKSYVPQWSKNRISVTPLNGQTFHIEYENREDVNEELEYLDRILNVFKS